MKKKPNETLQYRIVVWDCPINSKDGNLISIDWYSFTRRLYSNKQAIELIREEYRTKGKSKKYKQLKSQLPSVMPNVTHATNRTLEGVIKLSGLIYFDFDCPFTSANDLINETNNEDNLDTAIRIKEQLIQDPLVYACWISISGAGLGFIVQTEGLTKINFKSTWVALKNYFNDKYTIEIDDKVHNINRLCFISFDDNVYLNDESKFFSAISENELKSVENGNSITIIPDRRPFNTLTRKFKDDENLLQYNIKTEHHTLHQAKKIYLESLIDIHFSETLKKIKIDGKTVIFDGENHYWFAYKFPVVRIITKREIKMGERYKSLIRTLVTFSWLNPHINKKETFDWIKKYNQSCCTVPLSLNEMNNVMNYVYLELRAQNKLSPCVNLRHNHFTSICKLDKKGKLSKIGKIKTQSTLLKLGGGLQKSLDLLKTVNDTSWSKFAGVSRHSAHRSIKSSS